MSLRHIWPSLQKEKEKGRKKFLDILWHFEQDSLKRKHNLFTGKSQVKIASCSNYEYFEQ
jgi:hypothetical protein